MAEKERFENIEEFNKFCVNGSKFTPPQDRLLSEEEIAWCLDLDKERDYKGVGGITSTIDVTNLLQAQLQKADKQWAEENSRSEVRKEEDESGRTKKR